MTETDHTLLTDRLRLRRPRAEDFDDIAALWGDPVVSKHITGEPQDEEASWSRLLRLMGHWVALGYGPWSVEERATGAFVGEVGFREYRRETKPSFVGVPEIGWVLSPAFHGRGFAAEAVTAALAWADARLEGPRTVCIISEGNAPSFRLAERTGYAKYADGYYKGKTIVCLERFRPGAI